MTTNEPTSNALPSDGADDSSQTSRRSVVKIGVATAWAVPAVQTLTMSSAWAAGSEPPPGGTGSITGQVVDASNGAPIQGATVMADTGQSDTTDASGNYTLTNVPSGSRSVTASASGYISSTQSTMVSDGGTSVLNFALSRANTGAIRAVLNWTAQPQDLDLHVSGPQPGGGRFHVYYNNEQATDSSGDPYCELDVDDVDGNGPETQTITISNTEGDYVAGIYRVWVHNFSGGTFASGDATLNLFDRSTQRGSFSQDDVVGDDSRRIWLVVEFNVDDAGNVSAVTPLQAMADGSAGTQF